jgi:hypothetical protein
MSAIETESLARTELLAKLEELAAVVTRTVEISEELGWRHELGWPEVDLDDFCGGTPFEPFRYMPLALREATWEVLYGIGWGGSGPCCDREEIKAHAEALVELVAIARRREDGDEAGGVS